MLVAHLGCECSYDLIGRSKILADSLCTPPDRHDVARCKKPTVSNHLNEIEDAIELAFIRGKVRLPKKDVLQKKRNDGAGMRRASLYDFHAFRVTWITLALTSGIPIEIVQRVTGHKTVDVVLKHYFRPGSEEIRRAFQKAMPEFLTGGVGQIAQNALDAPQDATLVQVKDIASKATQATAWRDMQAIRRIIDTKEC